MKQDCEKLIYEILNLNNSLKAAERYYERMLWHEENFRKALAGDFFGIKPVTVDFLLNNICNYNCPGCTFNFIRKNEKPTQKRSMKKEHIPILISKLKDAGVKGIIFSGGGEPTLHPDLVYAMGVAKKAQLDFSLYTNGSFKDSDLTRRIIELNPTYVRVSLNAGEEIFKENHGIKKNLYPVVIENIRKFSQEIQRNNTDTTLGISFLINDFNVNHLEGILTSLEDVKKSSETHVDYVAIKPEINYRDPKNQLSPAIIEKINDFVKINGEVISERFGTNVFYNTFFANQLLTSAELNSPCISHGWVANVDWEGNMSFCVELAMDKDFTIGNLVEQEFDEIWNGERRLAIHKRVNENISGCPQVCRNKVKNYLMAILNTPYSKEETARIMDDVKLFKENRSTPNHINFL